MKYTIRELKTMAREALRGNYPLVIGAVLAVGGITLAANLLPMMLFSGDTAAALVMNLLFSLIISLIMCIFSAGLCRLYLNITRKNPAGFGDLFYLFQHHPDRAILAGLVTVLLSMAANIPLFYLNYRLSLLSLDSPSLFPLTLGCLLLNLVLAFLLTTPFLFTNYLLADHPEMGAGEALKGSIRMTLPNFGRILLLELSFFGLMILSVFTLYIALLWVIPYMETSITCLYLECSGEVPAARRQRESSPYDDPYGC